MTQLDELLQEHSESVPFSDAVERHALDQARHALRAAVVTEQTPAPRRRSTRHFGRFALIAGLAATTAVVVALLPGAGTDVGRVGPSIASAQTLLERAAQAISRHAWRPLSAGEYFYSREVGSNPGHNGPASGRPTFIQEAWFGPNGFARLVQTGPETMIPGGDLQIFHATAQQLKGERHRQRSGAHLRILAYSQKFRWGDLDYEQLIHLPTDPAKLLRYIEHHAVGGGPRFSDIFSYAQTLLGAGGTGGSPLPPKVSAAMYRVIARLPGMRLIGPTRDPLGRPGVAVGLFFKHQPGRIELIFNPKTGVLLGGRIISLSAKAGAPPGTVMAWSAIENQGVVHSYR
jgi:hypothetical protein